MAFVLILVYMLPLLSYASTALELQENNTLYLLTLAPFPDERYDPGFAGGPAIIPAVRLAVEHINNRTDILDGYTLKQVEADSGCANSANSVINFIRYVYHSGRGIVGIVGPACSGPTKRVGLFSARSEVSLLQVSTATSPVLTDEKYSNTFRAVSSALVYVNVFVRLMERNGWDQVATLYQESRRYFSSTYEKFIEVVIKNHIAFSSPIYERHIPLEQLQASRTRIVFVFAGGNLARRLMCLAYHFDFVYPKYQWVFHDRSHSEFIVNVSMVYNSKQYTCNETEMTKAISGAILNTYRLTRTDRTTNDTAALWSYNEYEVEYNQTRDMYLEELADRNVSVDSSDTETQYSNVYYDAVWALALALNKSIPMLESLSYDLSDYSYGQESITKVVRDQLISLNFEGMSGKINFSDTTRESNSIIDVYQVFNGSSELIGVYENSMLHRLNGSFISDSFRVVVDAIPEELGIVVLSAIIPPVAVATILLHVTNLLYSNHKSMKATSPTLNHLAFSGCYLFIVGAVFFTVKETWGFSDPSYRTLVLIQCSTFMWSTTMGYSLIFGSLCVKMWRLSRLYTNFRRYDSGRDGLIMSDYSLIGIALLIWLLGVGINLTWNLVDPWMLVMDDSETFDGVDTVTVFVYCASHYLPYWVATIVTYVSLLSMVVVYFSIRTRKIPKKDFKYSKHINTLVYMLVLLFSVGIPVYIFFLLSSAIVAAFVIMVVILLTTVVLCLLFLFLPSVIPLLKCSSCIRDNYIRACNVYVE